ncbi:hypothetical protein YC2023_008596 [Brassica napus]
MQSQEKKSPTDPPSVRRLVNQLKQKKEVLLHSRPRRIFIALFDNHSPSPQSYCSLDLRSFQGS